MLQVHLAVFVGPSACCKCIWLCL